MYVFHQALEMKIESMGWNHFAMHHAQMHWKFKSDVAIRGIQTKFTYPIFRRVSRSGSYRMAGLDHCRLDIKLLSLNRVSLSFENIP